MSIIFTNRLPKKTVSFLQNYCRNFTITDPYRVLGITPGASEKDIKDAYRKLCLKYHPDRNPNNKDEAEKKFKEIGEAYRMLTEGGTRPHPNQQQRTNPFQQGFPGFNFPGGFGFGQTQHHPLNFEDLFGAFHQMGGSTSIKEEIIMKNGQPWKRKITKTSKLSNGKSRTEVIEEEL